VPDPGEHREYARGVLPLLGTCAAEVLAADFDAEALEGEARGMNVAPRSPSEQAARAWYGDAEYGPVRRIRLRSTTNGSMVLLRGFLPPAT
jgi:uncharacterized protein (DUF1330 family)